MGKYGAGDLDERSSLTFIELAHETLTGSDLADLDVSEMSEMGIYLHGQEGVFPDGDAGQARLLEAAIVLGSDEMIKGSSTLT
jgi:hypothetical protein